MERTVPRTASEEIELYLRTVYSLLRSSTEVQIRTVEEVHAGMNSLLHTHARDRKPDTSAFFYSMQRLPSCMPMVRSVIMGQSFSVFSHNGYRDIADWQPVSARARRRRSFFNRKDTLACFISSRSDIDDLVPSLTAYQIEWNKLHELLQDLPDDFDFSRITDDSNAFKQLADTILFSIEDLTRLKLLWGDDFESLIQQAKSQKCSLRIRLISSSLSEYWRSTRAWWEGIEKAHPELLDRPVYFVSSNTHSLANILTGYALTKREHLLELLEHDENQDLMAEWQEIQDRNSQSSEENFFYYLLKSYQQTPGGRYAVQEQAQAELAAGIHRISSMHNFDIDAQVIDLSKLRSESVDPRLKDDQIACLSNSDALILNIDYPLGLAAYNVLSKVAEHVSPILGIYSMGKAATLNGVIGDVMIPTVVHDEHSQNTYLFSNVFKAADVSPYLVYGTVLDNQKAVSVMGTFLQNARFMDVFYREGYTDIEMESGSYLSAIYEMVRPRRHPVNEIASLYEAPFDIGILHYASDTPLSKGKNLGAGALSYFGMDSTYACTIAILRRILHLECKRMNS